MRIKVLFSVITIFLLAGCNTTQQLSTAGQQVKFTDTQPNESCQLLGEVSGEQSNWLSGLDESGGLRGAANDMRNKAAMMGGNVIYDATSPKLNMLSSFVPVSSKMVGKVYKCP